MRFLRYVVTRLSINTPPKKPEAPPGIPEGASFSTDLSSVSLPTPHRNTQMRTKRAHDRDDERGCQILIDS
jgi:hypothetical protein